MKKIFFITLLIGFCCTSCNEDVSLQYEELYSNWRDETNWQNGELIFYIFEPNSNKFQIINYGKAEGCDYTDKYKSYYKYLSKREGNYFRDQYHKDPAYNLYFSDDEEISMYFQRDLRNYKFYLCFGKDYDNRDNWERHLVEQEPGDIYVGMYIDIFGNKYNYEGETSGESGGEGTGGGGSGGGGTSDPTAEYTITRTSVCAIYLLDSDQNNGDKYAKEWYKWVSDLTGKVILSRSSSNSAYWVGVASKNNDSKCGKWPVYSYSYKVVDYTPVGGAWYYYFN